MKIAVIGSRSVDPGELELEKYLEGAKEIISGGAKGVDTCAANYATNKKIKLREFLPEYNIYGRGAPIIRNKKIVDYSDKVIAFWDGSSRGTLAVIKYAEKQNKPCQIVIMKSEQ